MNTQLLIDTTAFMFGVTPAAILGRSRETRTAEARQALAWALRQRHWAYEAIGDLLHRDHTTIIYAVRAVARRIERDPRFAERVLPLTEDAAPPPDWQERIAAIEARVAQLEALLAQRRAR